MVLEINNEYITYREISEFVTTLTNRSNKKELSFEIVVNKQLREIDVQIISYLILAKLDSPDLIIEIRLNFNSYIDVTQGEAASYAEKGSDEKIEHKLIQYMVYAFLITQRSVFTIKFKNTGLLGVRYDRASDTYRFPTSWYVLSKSFTPFMLVSQSVLYGELFEISLMDIVTNVFEDSLTSILRSDQQGKDSSRLYQACVAQARSFKQSTSTTSASYIVIKKSDISGLLVNLGRLAFYRTLRDAKLLGIFFDKNYRETGSITSGMRAGTYKGFEAYSYYEQVKDILDDLAQQSLFHQFLFSTLVSSDLIPAKLVKNPSDASAGDRDDFTSKLRGIWHFTKEVVHGLKELAKNIKEHADPPQGVIFCRIYKRQTLESLGKSFPDEADHFLETSVIDLGVKGIRQTLIESVERQDQKYQTFFKEDLDIIKKPSWLSLRAFLDPSSENSLKQQTKRATAHLGLLMFSKLINRNSGLISAGTWDGFGSREFYPRHDMSQIKAGTYYQVILPIGKLSSFTPHLPIFGISQESAPIDISNLEAMLGYEYREIDQIDKRNSNEVTVAVLRPKHNFLLSRKDEQSLWNEISQRYAKIVRKNDIVLSIDLEGIRINESQLFRLLGNWEIAYPGHPMIVLNITTTIFQDFIKLNNDYYDQYNYQNLPFWNKVSMVIFYSFIETMRSNDQNRRADRFYFTDCLSGETYFDFIELNKKVSRTNFNSSIVSGSQFEDNRHVAKTKGYIPDLSKVWKNVFYSLNNLIPFDLILTDPGGITLFERNSYTLLNNSLTREHEEDVAGAGGDIENPLVRRVNSISGYKLSDSHFKIGSKLHISTFYYAKRYFQNSFFASRFAYLLCRTIIQDHGEQRAAFVENGLALIGYGLYSELLLNLTGKFLKYHFDLEVKTELANDSDELSWLKGENISKNSYCIVIVPIASTFSTAIKIEEWLRQTGHTNVVSPHYNMVYISDGDLSQRSPIGELTTTEKQFGWTGLDIKNRIVSVDILDYQPVRSTRQKFLLSLESEWHDPLHCVLCFPKVNLLEERPLYETDKGSTTPLLILDFPKGRPDSDSLRPQFKLSPKSLKYGHYEQDHNHYHYYIDPNNFYLENNSPSLDINSEKVDGQITSWLLGLRGNFSRICLKTDSILLLTSGSKPNSSFINLVNDILFESAASIIHYNPVSDHIQNFLLTYGPDIERATKIIYVDDILSSNSTFLRFNHFLENIDRSGGEPIKFQACLILLNLSSYYVFENVRRRIADSTEFSKVFSFADIHVPTMKNPDGVYPIVSEQNRYLSLVGNSFLDSLKVHFIRQAEKLSPNNKRAGSERHVLMLKSIHLIYKFFSTNRSSLEKIKTLKDFKTALDRIPTPFRTTQEVSEETILKVLTQAPLTYYEPLRKYSFNWALSGLLVHINVIGVKIKTGDTTIADFTTLKFYIRRVALLNSSILLSPELIAIFLKEFYTNYVDAFLSNVSEPNKQTSLLQKSPLTNDQLTSLENFSIFYAAQVKELIYQSESRSLKLERTLKQASVDKKASRYGQLIRMLSEENVVLFQKFIEHISRSAEWKDLVISNVNDKSPFHRIDNTNRGLFNLLSKQKLQDHYRLRSLSLFFEESGFEIWHQMRIEESSFLSYLWLVNFLEFEERLSGLSSKTEVIIKQLIKILKGPSRSDIGAFFLVKYDVQTFAYFFAYNKNRVNGDGINEQSWRGDDDSFLYEFMLGVKVKPSNSLKTVIELKKSEAGSWEDLYNIGTNIQVPNLDYDVLPDDSNRLLLIRLSERGAGLEADRPQGIIGFYYRAEDEELTSTQLVRYLLLLRAPLSKFISKHHENDEFKDWQIASQRQKTALLTGHGSDMLINLSMTRGPEYKAIVETLLMVQRLILDNAEVDKYGFDKSHANQVFSHYFESRSHSLITPSYFLKIKTMAERIFGFEEIENAERVDVRIDEIESDLSFRFSEKIMDLIFFELILNAKKNRWVSIPYLTDSQLGGADINCIKISSSKSPDSITILVSNTCPKVDRDCIAELNRTGNVKDYDPSAGLKLIRTILDTFHLGKIYFEAPSVTTLLSNFIVKLTLFK